MRFEVRGDSMLPAFAHGDFLVVDRAAFRRQPPAPGEAVVARDPRSPGRMLLKRVARADEGMFYLLGDNPAFSTDSRHFGPLPADAILGRVAWRYWRASRSAASCSSTNASVGKASGGGEDGAT